MRGKWLDVVIVAAVLLAVGALIVWCNPVARWR